MSFSRSRTRRFLLQSLYTRAITGIAASKESAFFDEPERIEDSYVTLIESAILEQE